GREGWREDRRCDSKLLMESLDVDSLEALSAGDLRGLIVRLAAPLSALRVTVIGLEGRFGALQDDTPALREQAATLTREDRTRERRDSGANVGRRRPGRR